jgi:hypothetical protein
MSLGSAKDFPKDLLRWQAKASHQQIIWCDISVYILQNLQFGLQSNRPIIFRCFLTGAWPVRDATAVPSSVLNLSRPSVLFVHGLLIQSLRCL